jgi:hypothetical protein
MVLSKISELGGVIIGNEEDEIIVPCLADGTSKAGWAVSLNTSGQAVGTDVDAVDTFVGFLLPHHEIDMDTAITANLPCNIVIPRSGHLYGTFIVDLNVSDAGNALIFTTTAGSMGAQTDVEAETRAHTYRYDDGDTVGIVIWA